MVKKIVLYIETGLLAEAGRNGDQLKVFMGDYGRWTLRLVR